MPGPDPAGAGSAASEAQARERVRQAQEWVFERAPVGLAVIDAEGCLVAINDSLSAMIGTRRPDVVGRPVVDLLAPDQRATGEDWLAGALAAPGTTHLQGWIRPAEGEPRWVAVDSDRLLDDHGEVVAVVGAVTDLTEQRRLQGALASARDDLSSLFLLAPVAVVRLDAGGRVVAWNPAAERLLGWSEAEVRGAVPPVVPEGQADLHRTYQERALAGDPLDGTPVTCRARDGSLVEVLAWTYLADVDGSGDPEVVVLLADVTDQVEASRALRASEHRWRTLVENVSDTVTVVDAVGTVLATTGQTKTILGYPTEAWTGSSLLDLVHPGDLERLQPVIARVLASPGEEVHDEVRLRHRDGSWAEVAVTAVNLLDDPEVGGVVLTTRNTTEQNRTERLVASQARILELIARDASVDDVLDEVAAMVEDHDDGARAAVVLVDDDRLRPRAAPDRGPGPEVRAALSRMVLPRGAREALRGEPGEPVLVRDALTDPRTAALAPALAAEGLGSLWWASARVPDGQAYGGILALHPGDHVPDAHAVRASEVACTLLSIALERHATLAALAHRELHDDLTGLPNRTLLLDRIETGLERARRADGEVALLYVDLDRFKRINDSGGLTEGDTVLTTVARQLQEVTRPGDTVARVGADEFVVLCDQPGSLSTVLAVADRLTEALREPFSLRGHDVFVTASTGVALSHPEVDAVTLLGQADAAMDRAKQRGRDRLEVYDPAMQATAHDRLTLGSDLRRALARGEMLVVYQPIVDLDTGTAVGAEALLRWRHPERGDVPPDVFIPVAEESGAIVDIGAWVLETALAEVAPHVPADRAAPFTLAVNLSPRQLEDPTLVARVQGALRRHGWPAEQLCLELTETALTDDLDLALGVLVRLRATGARIAVDDFGTGYSSLTHLQALPIDSIKIDRSFVQGLGDHRGSERSTIARCVLGIAGAMDLEAVAEGVETQAQLEALRRLGCRRGQGYLFSVPVPADVLEAAVLGGPRPPTS